MSQKPTYEDLDRKVKALSEDLEFYRQKAKALEEINDYYNAFLELCGDGVVVLDPESTRPIDFNNQACQQLGYSREEFAQLCLRDIDAAETEEQTRAHMAKVMENGFDSFDTLQRTKQGEIRNVHVSAMMLDVGGRQTYQCIFRNITDNKTTGKALKEEEERFRGLFKHHSAAMLVYDPETGAIIDANDAAAKFYGWSIDELRQMSIPQINVLPLEAVIGELQKAAARGSSRGEYQHKKKDGAIRDVEVYRNVIEIAGRNFIYAIVHDITDRKLAEEAVQDSERRFRAAFMASPLAVVISTLDEGIWTDANQAALDMFGYTADQAIGKIIKDKNIWVDPADRQRILSALDHGKEVRNQIIQLRHADGHLITVSTSAAALTLKGERHILYVTEDITERKKAEAALVESEEKFRNFADQAIVGVFLIQDGIFKYVNLRFAEIFGYSVEQCLANMSFEQLVSPQDLNKVKENVHNRLSGKTKRVHYEFKGIRGNGDPVYLESFGSSTLFKGKPAATGTILDITDRKRAEEALRKSESTLSLLLETVPLPVFYKDRDGRYLKVNNAFEVFYGKSREEVIGKSVFDINPPDLAQIFHAQDVKLFEKPGIQIYDSQELDANGVLHDTIAYKAPLVDENGAVVGLVGAFLDITDRKRAEEALRKSESTLSLLLETVPLPVFYKDRQGRYLRVNNAFLTLLGKTKEQVIGKYTFDINPPELAQLYRFQDAKLFERGGIQIFDSLIQDADGALHDVISYKAPFADESGSLTGLVGVDLDITERKQAEDELRKYEHIVSSTEDMITLFDKHFVYLAVNEAYLKAIGKTAPETIGKKPADVLGEELFQNVIRPRIERCLTGETTHYQNWFDYPASGRRYVDAVYSPYLGKGGEVLGVVVTLRDITEYRNLQAQLSQAQKMESVGRLAGGVAHEYNNMLSIIMGYAEMAKGKVAPSHPLNADLMEILSAAKRSADITRQLLAFSRKQTVSPKVLDINDSIKSMFKMLRRLIGEDIELAWFPETNVWQVKTDPSQVDQILVNLCVNSRDALIGAGKITIETQNVGLDEHYCANNEGAVPGEYVMLAVSDNGCGIAPETLNKIFEPFFTTKGVGKGTGLGLATVYGIVKQNNGFIKACSEPGKGTAIRVYLPRHISQGVEETRDNHLEIPSGRGETILLVEDEVSILNFSQMLLKRLGYHEISTASPTEAIRLATAYTGKIDLLLTDVVMPAMNGRELFNRLQPIYPDLRVLFMSGYTADVIADRGILKEGVCFINKPFSIRDLAIQIREVLGTANPE